MGLSRDSGMKLSECCEHGALNEDIFSLFIFLIVTVVVVVVVMGVFPAVIRSTEGRVNELAFMGIVSTDPSTKKENLAYKTCNITNFLRRGERAMSAL